MDLQAFFDLQLQCYEEHGILMSQAELALFDSADHASIRISAKLYTLVEDSRAAIDRDLDLQTATLVEAEKAREEAVILREQAEQYSKQLEDANARLATHNTDITAHLAPERDLRILMGKTNFQRQFATYLIIIIAFSLALPYIGGIFGAPDKVIESTSNLSLLLVQTLAAVAAFLYSRRQGEKESE